jgi:hypothetical protein
MKIEPVRYEAVNERGLMDGMIGLICRLLVKRNSLSWMDTIIEREIDCNGHVSCLTPWLVAQPRALSLCLSLYPRERLRRSTKGRRFRSRHEIHPATVIITRPDCTQPYNHPLRVIRITHAILRSRSSFVSSP